VIAVVIAIRIGVAWFPRILESLRRRAGLFERVVADGVMDGELRLNARWSISKSAGVDTPPGLPQLADARFVLVICPLSRGPLFESCREAGCCVAG
jgi:hypothetical protein